MTEKVTMGTGSVFSDLNIRLTREEWAELCVKHGSKIPYPFKTELRLVK